MPRMTITIGLVFLVAIPASSARAQQAQPLRYAAGLVAGATQFDLSGTGTTAIVGARIEDVLNRWFVAEGAFGFFSPTEQFGSRRWYGIPEAQMQLQFPLGAVRPYLGVGGGWVTSSRGTRGTASGSGGLRAQLPGTNLDARAELRVRGIGRSFGAATAEWTLGLSHRF